MRIGVPKEIKNHEYRVGLTPPSVAELAAALEDLHHFARHRVGRHPGGVVQAAEDQLGCGEKLAQIGHKGQDSTP